MKGDTMSRLTNKFENLYRWSAHKMKLQDKFDKEPQLSVKYPRGAIYTCYLGENIGHEKSGLEARPCIIVSTNRINYKNTNVVVVPLSKVIKFKPGSTSKLAYDWHYVLRKSNYPKLSYDSAVQCEDIRCVSKARMGKYICQVNSDDMKELRKRIKSTLQI